MIRVLIAFVLASWLAMPAFGQPSQAPQTPQAPSVSAPQVPADARVGFVNLQVVLAKSVLGQRGSADLKKLTDERDADIQAKTKEINDLQAKLTGPGRQGLDRATASALTSELSRKRAQLNFDRETWQGRAEQESQAMLVRFRAALLPVVESVREERGLWIVFSLPLRGIIGVDPALDLSAEVIRRLDERTK